jgi:hypothetical protein
MRLQASFFSILSTAAIIAPIMKQVLWVTQIRRQYLLLEKACVVPKF